MLRGDCYEKIIMFVNDCSNAFDLGRSHGFGS